MKYLHLIWAALFRRKMRTIFTLLSVLAAFLLFGLLDSVRSAFTHAGEGMAGIDRLAITSKISPFVVTLPKGLYSGIQAVPGVTEVSYGNMFGGTYQDAKNFVPIEAHADNYFDLYPEWHLSPAERQAFHDTRTGAIVPEGLARKFNWKLGDKIPLQTNLYQKNGSSTWTFDLVGIYHVTNPNRTNDEREVLFHWDFFDEARQSGNGTVEWFIVKVADPHQADQIAQAIDALSANSDHETKTESENALFADILSEFGDIGLIVGSIMGAVFFTLVLLTGNTMSQAVRERIPELATLKTIGFTARCVMGLVLGEAVLLLVLGGALGLAAAAVVVGGVHSKLDATVPMLPVAGAIWLRGLILAIVIGLVVGTLPAVRGMRLRIVDALSGR